MRYDGGENWDKLDDYSYNLQGSYDSETSLTLFTVQRCPKPLEAKCVNEIRDQVSLLSDEDIIDIYQSIVS